MASADDGPRGREARARDREVRVRVEQVELVERDVEADRVTGSDVVLAAHEGNDVDVGDHRVEEHLVAKVLDDIGDGLDATVGTSPGATLRCSGRTPRVNFAPLVAPTTSR